MSVHRQLKITRGSIHICSAYAINASCKNFHCNSLHVCRAWLAGNCRNSECSLVHSLRTDHNKQVLAAVGVSELPQCDENLRYEVAIIFPQLCAYYALGKCKRPNCFKLHMCKELILNGRCTHQNCLLNYSFEQRERNILVKRGIKIPTEIAIGNTSHRTLQTLLTDVLCAGGSHAKLCSCKVPKGPTRNKNRAPGAASAASVADSSGSENDDYDLNDDDNDTRSVHSHASGRPAKDSQSGANRYGGFSSFTPSAQNSIDSANASVASADRLPRDAVADNNYTESLFNFIDLLDVTRAPATAVSDANGAIKNVSSIVKYLLRRGGWAPWAEFTDHFKISQDFDAMKEWLLAKQKQDVSFTGQKADWICPVNYKNKNSKPDEVLFSSQYYCL